ncbi:hypothetical protein AVEN_197100-1 [Araneus ventricosus]|uniref:Uncharacterized protein n=1 Tax=Araneus ventricosus TaxID=182803 RepID=A0A4Y2IZU3_ARAVE|nr:hypothetical protein AVEN_197100-1 [Araneus ventricosus]
MQIGVHRRRSWNSNEVGFPFSPFGTKMEKRFFEECDKSPVGAALWMGDARRRSGKAGEIRESREGALANKWRFPVSVGDSLAGGRLGGSKRPIVHFGASVDDPPKSIELN